MGDDISSEDLEFLDKSLGNFPKPRDKETGVVSFFKRVLSSRDTRKAAFLTEDELGLAHISVRGLLNAAEICNTTTGWENLAKVFEKRAETILATSLSREGFLNRMVVTSKREMSSASRSSIPKRKRAWFSRKQEGMEVSEGT